MECRDWKTIKLSWKNKRGFVVQSDSAFDMDIKQGMQECSKFVVVKHIFDWQVSHFINTGWFSWLLVFWRALHISLRGLLWCSVWIQTDMLLYPFSVVLMDLTQGSSQLRSFVYYQSQSCLWVTIVICIYYM